MRALAMFFAILWLILTGSTVCATSFTLTITETGTGITATQSGFDSATFTYGSDGESVTAVLTALGHYPQATGTGVFPVLEYWGGPPSDYLSVETEALGTTNTVMTIIFQSDVDGVSLVVPPAAGGATVEYGNTVIWIGGDFWTAPDDYFTIVVYDAAPPEVVPLPPAAFLLGSGLIPLAWARRKKRLGR